MKISHPNNDWLKDEKHRYFLEIMYMLFVVTMLQITHFHLLIGNKNNFSIAQKVKKATINIEGAVVVHKQLGLIFTV